MMLAAATGTVVQVTASGSDAEIALDAITALLADRFGEDRDDNLAANKTAARDI